MAGLKTLKAFSPKSDEDVLLFSHQTSSMKHHRTETHKYNFEIHNIVLSSQSIFLKVPHQYTVVEIITYAESYLTCFLQGQISNS